MPRKYIRKAPERSVVTNDQLNAAKLLISQGTTQRQAAIQVGLKESSLRKRLKAGCTVNHLGRFSATFTAAQEEDICGFIKIYKDLFYGISMLSLRKLIYEYAEINQIPHRFNKSSQIAGREWVYSFMKRYPELKLRRPIQSSVPRAVRYDQNEVQEFHNNLQAAYKKHNFPPSRIFNMGESKVYIDPENIPKIVSLEEKKLSGKNVSTETGQIITLVFVMSASGYYIPPAFIFPRKRMRDYLMNDAPEGSIGMVSDSGYLTKFLFLGYLSHFYEYVQPTKDNPVLLILGDLNSNISLAAVNYCRNNDIHMLTVPPHSGHKMQPLDGGFLSTLMMKFASECDKWLIHNPNRLIGQNEVALLVNEAFKEAASVSNAETEFRNSGIWPIDEKMFSDTDSKKAGASNSKRRWDIEEDSEEE